MPDGEKGCESCLGTAASRWYQWGPAHEHCRLCNFCYTYWRKYGGLKLPTRWGEFPVSALPLCASAAIASPEASEKKAGVMTATGLLQRKLNKGGSCLPPQPVYHIVHVCLSRSPIWHAQTSQEDTSLCGCQEIWRRCASRTILYETHSPHTICTTRTGWAESHPSSSTSQHPHLSQTRSQTIL